MATDKSQPAPRKRLLDPVERTSEVLFGLIMALTFTCSFSTAEAGHESVKAMLIGAIGCNIAWGLIDGIMFLMANLTERGRSIAALKAVRGAQSKEKACAIIAATIPPMVADALPPDALATAHEKLKNLTDVPEAPRLQANDFLASLGVFLLVFLATFPVAIPFMVMRDAGTAVRVSNGIALVMLFLAGYAFGKYAQHRPVRMGVVMMLVGSFLVALTIALGG
jgi:hypothetical protein